MRKVLVWAVTLIANLSAQQGFTLQTAVGSGARGDGARSTSAILDGPFGLAEDLSGNIYVSESNMGVIRRINRQGIIERFAGSGRIADGAEGREASETDLIAPTVLLVDDAGSLIFADAKACRIRRVLLDGTIRNLVGTGRCAGQSGGFPGGGGGGVVEWPALEIDLGAVGGMVLDSAGRLVFSDETNHVVRRIDTDGIVRVLAGLGSGGSGGDGAAAVDAQLNAPRGLVFDGSGTLYIADSGNCRVRKVDIEGNINFVMGGSCSGTGSIGSIYALAYDASSHGLLVASPALGQIQRLDLSSRTVTVVAGSGQRTPMESGAALSFSLNRPTGLLVSESRIFIADYTAFHVFKLESGIVSTFAGTWPQLDVYPAPASAWLLRPRGLCLDPSGALRIVDEGAERILSLSTSNRLAAYAGARSATGSTTGNGGQALAAQFSAPTRVVCAADGGVYVLQGGRIRAINASGVVQALDLFVRIDQTTSSVTPAGIALDVQGRLVVSDATINRILRYDPGTRTTTVIAGSGVSGFRGDGGAATDARLAAPADLAFDSHDNLLVADKGNGRIRRISSDGAIQTIAGSARGFSYSSISGRGATEIGLGSIDGIALDANDNIYVSELLRISVVRSDGKIYVLAGLESQGDSGSSSFVHRPMNGCDGIAVDTLGRVHFSERYGGRVWTLVPEGLTEPGDPPVIHPGGVISSTAFGATAGLAPGSWMEIYGDNLATVTAQWSGSDFKGAAAPTSIGGTTVYVGGKAVPVSYISPSQVNAYLPLETALGSQAVTVGASAGMSGPQTINVTSTQPGLYAPPAFLIGGQQYVGATIAGTTSFAIPSIPGLSTRPARPGETITLYGVGFGTVSPSPNPGEIVQQTNSLVATVKIQIAGIDAATSYAGLAPGAIGLYQFNIVVPAISSSPAAVTLSVNGVKDPRTWYLAVQP